MAVITAGTALAIGAGTAAIGTAVGVAGANKQRRAAQRNKSKAEREIKSCIAAIANLLIMTRLLCHRNIFQKSIFKFQ